MEDALAHLPNDLELELHPSWHFVEPLPDLLFPTALMLRAWGGRAQLGAKKQKLVFQHMFCFGYREITR